jgi:hypothetical protein
MYGRQRICSPSEFLDTANALEGAADEVADASLRRRLQALAAEWRWIARVATAAQQLESTANAFRGAPREGGISSRARSRLLARRSR